MKCDRTFSYKANLKKHKESQVHERKKLEYKCEKCTEIFTRKEKLAKHDAFVHEGNKPAFKCHLCSLAVESNLYKIQVLIPHTL